MKLDELLQSLPADVLVSYSAEAAAAQPIAARWISRILMAELSRRNGEPAAPVPPLLLGHDDVATELHWLGACAFRFTDAGMQHDAAGLVALGTLHAHVAATIEQRMHSPMH